jgi:hypothetical protein
MKRTVLVTRDVLRKRKLVNRLLRKGYSLRMPRDVEASRFDRR